MSDEHDNSAEAAADTGSAGTGTAEATGTARRAGARAGQARGESAAGEPAAGETTAGEDPGDRGDPGDLEGEDVESAAPGFRSADGPGSDAAPGGGVDQEQPAAGTEPQEDATPQEDAASQEDAAEEPELPESVTLRVSRASLLVPLAIAACATPVATLAGGPAPLLYLVPAVLAVWIVRSSTVVDAGGLTVRTLLRTRRIAWGRLRALRLRENGWISAVLDSDQQVRLSGVRTRDVPKLALLSGGRLPNPEQQE